MGKSYTPPLGSIFLATFLWLGQPGIGVAQPVDLLTRTVTDLGDGVYSFGSFSVRSIFIVTSEGVIVTDPANERHAEAMLAAVRELTPLPVRYVVYSHQHWDHVLGGHIFKEDGAVFISHTGCLKSWQRHPNPSLVLPDITMEDSGTLELGGRTLNLRYHGPNHGECLFVMQVEGHDVLYVNDLVTPYSLGLGFMPDYDPVEWLRTLKELEADPNWARMVGAHGIPVAPREALSQRKRYLESLMTAVQQGIEDGKRLDALYDTIELPEEFRSIRGYDTQLKRAAERIYHYYTMGW